MPGLKTIAVALSCVFMFSVAAYVHIGTWEAETTGRDVYYSWVEGRRILSGENPYARILAGNMRENDKYATYFPLFYLLSSLSQAAGLQTYSAWINFWRYIFLAFHLGIGGVIFLIYYQKQLLLMALAGASLWLLSNWAITVSYIAQFDFIPIFFLLLSLYLFDKHLYTSLAFFSLSLALKQIAIFLVPLYLIWIWQSQRVKSIQEIVTSGLAIALLPALFSLPFIIWQPEGFFRSIVFSVTRDAYSGYAAGAQLSDGGGLVSRLPLFLLLGLVYTLAVQGKLGRYTSSMLAMLVFTALTPVLFPQYMVWLIALVILSVYDALEAGPTSPGREPLGR